MSSVLISGRYLPSHKHLWVALTTIYGIGPTTGRHICRLAKINQTTKAGQLTDAQVEQLRSIISDMKVETERRREVDMNIKRKMELGSYQGIRHPRGLPVNGQRTKTNAKTRKKRKKRS